MHFSLVAIALGLTLVSATPSAPELTSSSVVTYGSTVNHAVAESGSGVDLTGAKSFNAAGSRRVRRRKFGRGISRLDAREPKKVASVSLEPTDDGTDSTDGLTDPTDGSSDPTDSIDVQTATDDSASVTATPTISDSSPTDTGACSVVTVTVTESAAASTTSAKKGHGKGGKGGKGDKSASASDATATATDSAATAAATDSASASDDDSASTDIATATVSDALPQPSSGLDDGGEQFNATGGLATTIGFRRAKLHQLFAKDV
ncbi:hypothetical protein DENSPDRAFT_842524 [Dentipellis sp. KUC8613]|nr:hypothetical protein DENSPDRAFT_842524 [Dentipellis sp. KUC8613]